MTNKARSEKSTESDDSVKKRRIAETYVKIVQQKNMFPSRADLASVGITRDTLRHYFVNLTGLRNFAKELFPEAFEGIIREEDHTSVEALAKLAKDVKKYKTFIITTAVNGQWLHPKFMEGLEFLAEQYKAKILILPSHDPAHNLDNEIEWHFDDLLKDHSFVFDSLILNSNIRISSLRINAKQINPTTGLGRICQGRGSFIFGSPKQSLEYDPVSSVKFPHARMSTGACTIGNYSSTLGNSQRTAYLAYFDHVVGALIVEIEDEKVYHFRQIQADKKGGFCDLGKYYLGRAKPQMVIPKLVMGDYHAGEHDETAIKAWEEIIDAFGVDEVFFHDLFNGKSINHHEEENIVLRARNSEKGLLSLENEIKVTAKELDRILSHKSISKGIVVKSNHDEFLQRWVEQGKFKYDPLNFKVGCQLATIAVEKNINMLASALIWYGGKIDNFSKIVFLDRDEDYKIAGIECGAHGDKGSNGARGSKSSIENAYGRAIIGHSHTPGILRGVYQVGTSSLFKLGYNQGASSWFHTSCLIYSNGQRQLINSIGGKWRLKR